MNAEHKDLVNRIRAAAETLQGAVGAVPEDRYARRPDPDEWSIQEILFHVRNVVCLAYGLRIRRLFSEDEPQFADYDEGKARTMSFLQMEPVPELVQMIAAEHEQLARLLSNLPPQGWERVGYHARAGAMSVAFLARRTAEHAEEHTRQIQSTAAALEG